MVARGELKAPIVIGRDHLDSGSVASPNRETEAMKDGSDAVSDWPLLNALLNCASGATWVSLHHGGGVGIGYSQHAGMVIVADGTPEAAQAASSACCGTIRPPVSCATRMRATRPRSTAPATRGSICRAWRSSQPLTKSFGIVIFAPSIKVWTASRTIASRSDGIGVS